MRIPLILSVLMLAAASAGSGRACPEEKVPLCSFIRDCEGLAAGRKGQNTDAAALIISCWIQGTCDRNLFITAGDGPKDPLATVFKQAEDPVWCAASIGKFVAENRDSLPDSLPAAEMLPLWWMSAHPGAEPRHQELLRARLLALKAVRQAAAPGSGGGGREGEGK